MVTKTEERRHVNAWIEPDLVRRLDEKAREADRSRSAEIRLALRRHFEREHAHPSEKE
jgi:predicted transcriptional regulator